MTFKLKEGLKVGDFVDILNPILSIDEYKSKIDEDAIVVALKTRSAVPYPANDLSEFIETGRNEVLDTDVSAGPDGKGNYILFIEFVRNEVFPENLIQVLESMYSLCMIDDWKYTFFGGEKKLKDLTMKNLENDIRLEKLNRDDVTPDDIKESIAFFKNSDLDNVRITLDKLICFEKNDVIEMRQSLGLGDPTMLMEALNLRTAPIQLDNQSLRECRNLRGLLGDNWDVTKINDHYILANSSDKRVMIVK